MMMTLGIGLRGVPTGMIIVTLMIVRVVVSALVAGTEKFATCHVMMLGSLGPGDMTTTVKTSAATRAETPMTGAWISASRLDGSKKSSFHHPRVKSRSK